MYICFIIPYAINEICSFAFIQKIQIQITKPRSITDRSSAGEIPSPPSSLRKAQYPYRVESIEAT